MQVSQEKGGEEWREGDEENVSRGTGSRREGKELMEHTKKSTYYSLLPITEFRLAPNLSENGKYFIIMEAADSPP